MAISPNYYSTQMQSIATISTANPNRDGTGDMADIVTGGDNGSKVEKLRIQSTGSTTAGAITLFVSDGVTTKFYMTIPVTNEGDNFSDEVDLALDLPRGYTLKVATVKAEEFNLYARGGHY